MCSRLICYRWDKEWVKTQTSEERMESERWHIKRQWTERTTNSDRKEQTSRRPNESSSSWSQRKELSFFQRLPFLFIDYFVFFIFFVGEMMKKQKMDDDKEWKSVGKKKQNVEQHHFSIQEYSFTVTLLLSFIERMSHDDQELNF
jgi:hypothetical protein